VVKQRKVKEHTQPPVFIVQPQANRGTFLGFFAVCGQQKLQQEVLHQGKHRCAISLAATQIAMQGFLHRASSLAATLVALCKGSCTGQVLLQQPWLLCARPLAATLSAATAISIAWLLQSPVFKFTEMYLDVV
jgi:hypothetical protein